MSQAGMAIYRERMKGGVQNLSWRQGDTPLDKSAWRKQD